MRQTLWAEQVIGHKSTECLKADDYWHLHVVPVDNETLLASKYKVSGKAMEETWRGMLRDQSKYSVVGPASLFAPLAEEKAYHSLIEYLKARYW